MNNSDFIEDRCIITISTGVSITFSQINTTLRLPFLPTHFKPISISSTDSDPSTPFGMKISGISSPRVVQTNLLYGLSDTITFFEYPYLQTDLITSLSPDISINFYLNGGSAFNFNTGGAVNLTLEFVKFKK